MPDASTVLFAVLACGDGDDDGDGEAFGHQIDDARTHADALRIEVENHVAAAETAVARAQ